MEYVSQMTGEPVDVERMAYLARGTELIVRIFIYHICADPIHSLSTEMCRNTFTKVLKNKITILFVCIIQIVNMRFVKPISRIFSAFLRLIMCFFNILMFKFSNMISNVSDMGL